MILEHNEGLICTTTCTTSLFSRILNDTDNPDREKDCRLLIDRFHEAFGDRFYFELQPWNYDEQNEVNRFPFVAEMKKRKIEPVLTCDVHYAEPSDQHIQDQTISVMQGKTIYEEKKFDMLGAMQLLHDSRSSSRFVFEKWSSRREENGLACHCQYRSHCRSL